MTLAKRLERALWIKSQAVRRRASTNAGDRARFARVDEWLRNVYLPSVKSLEVRISQFRGYLHVGGHSLHRELPVIRFIALKPPGKLMVNGSRAQRGREFWTRF